VSWNWKTALRELRKQIRAGAATADGLLDFYTQLADVDPDWGTHVTPLVEQSLQEGVVSRALISEIGHYTTAAFQVAEQGERFSTTWSLPPNPVWNLPAEAIDVGELRGESRLTRGPFASIAGWRALAVDSEFRRVFGPRELLSPRESGYSLEGRVKLGGDVIRAFTSSQMFAVFNEGYERERLVDVATLYVCFADWPSHGYSPLIYDDPNHPLPRIR